MWEVRNLHDESHFDTNIQFSVETIQARSVQFCGLQQHVRVFADFGEAEAQGFECSFGKYFFLLLILLVQIRITIYLR